MRKTLIALMFAAALPTVAMAMPEGGPRHDGPHHRGDAPFAQLDLSRDQRQQIGKLMGEQMQHRREITERYLNKLPAAEQKAMKDELKASHDKTDSQVRALLKPDQQKKFDELQRNAKPARLNGRSSRTGKLQKPPRPSKLPPQCPARLKRAGLFLLQEVLLRSLFWRILASFWLAITLVAGLSILLGHVLNQDAWILSRHPGLKTMASHWAKHYEQEGLESAQAFLERRKQRYKIDVQVLDDSGDAVVPGLSRAALRRSRRASTMTSATCRGGA